MKLSGTFLDINDTPIEVVVENPSITTSNIVIGCAGDDTNVFFGDDPLSVDEDYDSTFDVMVQKSGQLTLLTKGDTNLVGILFANNQHNVTITINKNGDCVFYGFVEPNVYSQDYAEEYTQLDINFTDFLSTLQYGKLSDKSTYNEAKQAASTLSFKDYIAAMGFFDIGNVYFDKSSKVGDTEIDPLSGIGVSGSLFFGDTEDDEWTFEDILKEILQYLNLHIIQIGTDFYIFDWSTLTQSRETNEKDTMDFLCLNDGSVQPLYFPKKSYKITKPDYASNDTQISVDEVYNQIQVKCDLKDLETIVESPLDSEKLVSLYPKRFLYCTEYAVKKKSNNPILSVDVGDFNNIIHNQSVDNDNAHKYDWYMRPLLNNSWKFYLNKSVNDDTIESIYPKLWIDGQGSVYSWPWKVSDYLKQNALTPCMFNMAYIDTLGKNISDNEVKNDFDDNSNYLYISVNGNGDDTETGHKPSDDEIKAHSGMIEYQPSNSAVILSPTDDTSTNYLVFSGKISLQPLTYDSIGKGTKGDFINYGTLMKDAGGYAKSCYAIGFKGGNGDKHGEEEINDWYQYTRKWYNNDGYFYKNSLSPYVQERSPWKYKYNYTSSGDRSDKYMKLPILECEMTVGDKRLIETNIDQYGNSTFKWVKIGEEPKGIDNEPITTFSLGVNPKIGDCIIGTEFDLQNTIDPFMNIDGSGTAIPIKASDKLSGKITFKILGPINLTWNNVTRRHPSFWRHTKWTEGTVFVLAHTENIVLKDFECKIKTSSDIIMNKTNNDLIYMSDETKKYIKKNDSTEMKINTLLTTQEAYELGVSNSVNLSTAIDMSTSMPLKTIQKKDQDKPEQLYVDAYWNEYNKQRMLIDVTFKTTDFGDTMSWRFRPIKFNYFDGGFYPISTKINYKNDQTTMKLKEGAALSEEFDEKYNMDLFFVDKEITYDGKNNNDDQKIFAQKVFGAPRFTKLRWYSSNSDIVGIDEDTGELQFNQNDGTVVISVYGYAPNYYDGYAEYTLIFTNVPIEVGPNDMVISWNCYDNYVRKRITYKEPNTIYHGIDAMDPNKVSTVSMEQGIPVPEENKKFITLGNFQDIGPVKVYSSIIKDPHGYYSEYEYNAVLKDCKINGRPMKDIFVENFDEFPFINDDDLSPSNPQDTTGNRFWHKIKDLAMDKWNLVMIGMGNYIDNLKSCGSSNLALESLSLIEVRQIFAGFLVHLNDTPFRNYSRIAIGNSDTDKFKFSITPPLISGKIDPLYYIHDWHPEEAGLRYLFTGQVGIGPTLNLDWICSDNGNLLSMNGMFDGCENLEEISMPNYRPNPELYNSDKEYYKYTFRNCHKLKKIDDGPTLTKGQSIEHSTNLIGTFENCYSLKYINFLYADADTGHTTPSNAISKTVFKNCNSLQAIFIGNWDELNSEDKQVITDKFNNLLQLSGLNPDTIYIGKYDLTVIH